MMKNSDPLSKREQEVVNLVMEGKSNKLIASALHITIRTVEFHLKNVYEKLEVRSRTELIIKLGQSTVAGEGQTAENRDHPDRPRWAVLLRDAISKISKEYPMKDSLTSSASGAMTFNQAIQVCLRKYAEFEGRAARPEFWWFTLFVALVASALTYIHQTASEVFLIAVLLPFLAAGARRLRDIGKSPWWLWFLLVPVGGIVVLGYFWSQPSASPRADESPPA